MPIREYQCLKCGEVFEVFHRSQAEDQQNRSGTHCIKCGYRADPIVSQTARPRFKGSGFYENDYRKGA